MIGAIDRIIDINNGLPIAQNANKGNKTFEGF
jgi:hypothetical protein